MERGSGVGVFGNDDEAVEGNEFGDEEGVLGDESEGLDVIGIVVDDSSPRNFSTLLSISLCSGPHSLLE